jgi:hypothetical protein
MVIIDSVNWVLCCKGRTRSLDWLSKRAKLFKQAGIIALLGKKGQVEIVMYDKRSVGGMCFQKWILYVGFSFCYLELPP